MKYNIIHAFNILVCCPIIFLITSPTAAAQHLVTSRYGVGVIQSLKSYRESVNKDSSKRMINLEKAIPGILLDLRYASTHNFMKRRMYPGGTVHSYMRLPAAKDLLAVQQELNEIGLGLKIFDAYRPYSVTEKFWEAVHDDRYVADPHKASGHNRGIAVDLTIIDLKTKKELEMPTGFDSFSDTAHQDFKNLPDNIIRNRELLRAVMTKHGFEIMPTEWWHFSLPHPEYFEPLDLDFTELEKGSAPSN